MSEHDGIRDSLNENLGNLYVSRQQRDDILQSIITGQRRKKKRTLALVLALLMVLAVATAAADALLKKSKEAEAFTRARQALYATYGLTAESLGCFIAEVEHKGGTWTIRYRPEVFHTELLGNYTVTIEQDRVTAAWTHDHAEKALWQNAGLEAPVWGQPQIALALRDMATADAAAKRLVDNSRPTASLPAMTPPALAEGESWWQGEILRKGKPGEGDISLAQAKKIALHALEEEFAIPRAELEQGEFVHTGFYIRSDGRTMWGFDIHLMRAQVAWGCGVMMDAKTAEVLFANVTAGGNE